MITNFSFEIIIKKIGCILYHYHSFWDTLLLSIMCIVLFCYIIGFIVWLLGNINFHLLNFIYFNIYLNIFHVFIHFSLTAQFYRNSGLMEIEEI